MPPRTLVDLIKGKQNVSLASLGYKIGVDIAQ